MKQSGHSRWTDKELNVYRQGVSSVLQGDTLDHVGPCYGFHTLQRHLSLNRSRYGHIRIQGLTASVGGVTDMGLRTRATIPLFLASCKL